MTKACQCTPHSEQGCPTIFNDKNLKIGPKFKVWAPITLRPKGSNLTKLLQSVPWDRHNNLGTTFWGPAPLKFTGAKTSQILCNFRQIQTIIMIISWTDKTSKEENSVINYNLDNDEKDSAKFGPLTTKFSCLISTHIKINRFWYTTILTYLIRNISGTDRDIDKRETVISSTVPPTFNRNDLVNCGPLTKKFSCLMFTRSTSTLHIQLRLLQLRSPGGVAKSRIATP